MKIAVFSTKPYDRQFLDEANAAKGSLHQIQYFEAHLEAPTVQLAAGADVVCPFVNDKADAAVLAALAGQGTRLIALRGAGFNNVDLEAAAKVGMAVARVPAYSPYAIAEHTLALILSLNRKTYRSHARVREGNFSLDGLLGFDLHGKTVGIVGVGRIGLAFARIMAGLGCEILAHDPVPNEELLRLGARYMELDEMLRSADIVSLHCPLTPETHHLVDEAAVRKMKRGVMLVNTSRGAVLETRAVIRGLKDGTIGYLGLDVYEEEGDLFFEDLSDRILLDDVFARLLTFPNVLITAHQGFFTKEAMRAIAGTTIGNVSAFATTGRPLHEVRAEQCVVRRPS